MNPESLDFDSTFIDTRASSSGPDSNTQLDMEHLNGDNASEIDMNLFTNHASVEGDQVEVPPAAAPSRVPQVPPQPLTDAPKSAVTTDDMFRTETGMSDDEDEDEDDDSSDSPDGRGGKRAKKTDVPGGFTFVDTEASRRKIRIEYIPDKSRRHITFSKRKAGIMKKAFELSTLTGTQVMLLVVSETGLVYTFTTGKLSPIISTTEGKKLIQACLNAPDGVGPDGEPLPEPVAVTRKANGALAIRPHKLSAANINALADSAAQAASSAQASSSNGHASGSGPMTTAPPARQHADMAAMGHGNPASRPKKRLPSRKVTASAAMAAARGADVPPVPPLPDMHAHDSQTQHAMMMQQHQQQQDHQHQHHQQQQQHQSQQQQQHMSSAYSYPQEYGHNHPGQSYSNPAFGYGANGYDYYNSQMNGQYILSPTAHMAQPQHHHQAGPHMPSQGGSSHSNGNGIQASSHSDGQHDVESHTMSSAQQYHMGHSQERHGRDVMLGMTHAG